MTDRQFAISTAWLLLLSEAGKETGADMKAEYKKTARGGLAVNVIECCERNTAAPPALRMASVRHLSRAGPKPP
ncbi:hypothetical protein ACWIID_44120 [Streptomyces phaeochromogenes]